MAASYTKPRKSYNGTFHIASTMSNIYPDRNERGHRIKQRKNVWEKKCVKCGDDFTIDDRKDSAVRKCLKCKYA